RDKTVGGPRRLFIEDVESGRAKLTAVKRGEEHVVVNQGSPRGVDNEPSRAEAAEMSRRDDARRGGAQLHMQRDDVATLEEFIELHGLEAIDPVASGPTRVHDNAHADRTGVLADETTRRTPTDHTERAPGELVALWTLPAALAE